MNRAKEDIDEHGGERQMVQALFSKEMQKTSDGFPKNQIFPPERVEFSLGRLISDAGLSQLRITESEKYPHVTYFFNCRLKDQFPREDRLELPSPKEVSTYDQKPEMSTYEVTNTVIQKIEEGLYESPIGPGHPGTRACSIASARLGRGPGAPCGRRRGSRLSAYPSSGRTV